MFHGNAIFSHVKDAANSRFANKIRPFKCILITVVVRGVI